MAAITYATYALKSGFSEADVQRFQRFAVYSKQAPGAVSGRWRLRRCHTCGAKEETT